MNKTLKITKQIILFSLLTIITQIGGLVYVISLYLQRKFKVGKWSLRFLLFLFVYSLFTFLLVPLSAPFFGRERIKHSKLVAPTNYLTVFLNRNYVRPEVNKLFASMALGLKETGVTIHYLDANFPYLSRFPLLPHLSHYDGKKVDVSLIYETTKGEITSKQKSISGYGVFAGPLSSEVDQINTCLSQGYFQYDYPKYLTFGKKNKDLKFSRSGTRLLVNAILASKYTEKLFIEPHLKQRLHLSSSKIRYHGCRAVRHDDHIHIQVK